MLTTARITELELYGLLTIHASTTAELTNTLEVPPRTLKEHVKRINDFALDYLRIDQNLILVDFKGNYAVNPLYYDDKDIIYGYLKLAAYKTSPKFQILLALILNVEINKHTLTRRLYITQSRVTTLVGQLNEDMAKWNIEITSEQGLLRFSGNELNIRLYSYAILNDAFQSLRHADKALDYTSPFHYEIEHFSDPCAFPERFETSSVVHLQKIIKNRLAFRQFLDPIQNLDKPELVKFFEELEKTYDTSSHIEKLLCKELSDEHRQAEKLYFNFFSRIIFPDSVPQPDKMLLVTELQAANDHYVLLATKCLDFLQAEKFLDENIDFTKRWLIYFLTLYLVYYDVMGNMSGIITETRLNIPDYTEQGKSQVMEQLTVLLTRFFAENGVVFPQNVDAIYNLTFLITSSIKARKPAPLKVFIQTNNETAKRLLINDYLTSIFNATALDFVDGYRGADLIITDNIGEFSDAIPVLYFKSTTSREQWRFLTDTIEDMLVKRMIYR